MKWRILFVAAAAVVFAVAEPSDAVAPQSGPAQSSPAPTLEVRPLPRITLERAAVSTGPAAEIRKLISDLGKIDQPYFGLSPTLDGWAFAPISGLAQANAFMLTNHDIVTPQAFLDLVTAGPGAIPYLLDSLDDKTPTGLSIEDEGFDAMWFDRELDGNDLNQVERLVLASVKRASPEEIMQASSGSYSVKVGDVCFTVLGQIVGRRYLAVRYQPTGCIVINSPTEDRRIVECVRRIWSSEDPAQHLLDSLLLDYSSEGISDGDSLGGWGEGSRLQTSAATRLLYYFPKQTAALIADRLRGLQVHSIGRGAGSWHTKEELNALTKREVANGVRTDDFVKAVAWCKEPLIQAELVSILERTDDPDLLVATAEGVGQDHKELVLERLGARIDALPFDEGGSFGDGYNLLVAAGRVGGAQAKAMFLRYVQNLSIQRCRTMSHVLRETRGEWAVEILLPLLDDKRETDWDYAVKPGKDEPELPIRVCDDAAETLSIVHPDLAFEMVGDHETLDRQIKAMKTQILRSKEAS